MGGKRYHCEYCDRSFKDSQGTRKKHLDSMQHIKNRNEYYNQLKDPASILEEEIRKKPCLRLQNTGECMFGSVCRYSHYTLAMLEHLKAIVAAKKEVKSYDPNPEWIMKEFFRDTIDPEDAIENDINLWPLPPELENYSDLPPSLKLITYKDFTSPPELPDWGWK